MNALFLALSLCREKGSLPSCFPSVARLSALMLQCLFVSSDRRQLAVQYIFDFLECCRYGYAFLSRVFLQTCAKYRLIAHARALLIGGFYRV